MEKTVKSPATIGTAADFLADQEHKSLLRFLTCGSVDDGKSTLIGRLLYDTRLIFEDQLAALKSDSRKFGAADGELEGAQHGHAYRAVCPKSPLIVRHDRPGFGMSRVRELACAPTGPSRGRVFSARARLPRGDCVTAATCRWPPAH